MGNMMQLANVQEQDLDRIFKFIDASDSGVVELSEFMDSLYKMKTDGSQELEMQMFIKETITEMHSKLCLQFAMMKSEMNMLRGIVASTARIEQMEEQMLAMDSQRLGRTENSMTVGSSVLRTQGVTSAGVMMNRSENKRAYHADKTALRFEV